MNERKAIMDLQEYIGSGEYNGTNPPIYLLTANLAINALEKQIAKKPISTDWLRCPTCNVTLKVGLKKYCEHCGQKLDWSEV